MLKIEDFTRAANDIINNGDSDILPHESDIEVLKAYTDDAVNVVFNYCRKNFPNDTYSLIFENLLSVSGYNGFRQATKLGQFWNLLLNGLCAYIARELETKRSKHVYSYRFLMEKDELDLFCKRKRWVQFRSSILQDLDKLDENEIILETDITGFYSNVSHHFIENCISEIISSVDGIPKYLGTLLSKMTIKRSFGLPIGGNGARILAEAFLNNVDDSLEKCDVNFYRYVDDFVIISKNREAAYNDLVKLSDILSGYGLSLNKNKTHFFPRQTYAKMLDREVNIHGNNDAANLLKLDIYYDPYSQDPDGDYEQLRKSLANIDVSMLLNAELNKIEPDSYMVSQIVRSLEFSDTNIIKENYETLLSEKNLYSFRSSFPTIMKVCDKIFRKPELEGSFKCLNSLLDKMPNHSSYLLQIDVNLIYYLRALRYSGCLKRTKFVLDFFERTKKNAIKRWCLEYFRRHGSLADFENFKKSAHNFNIEVKKSFWLMTYKFTDSGRHFRKANKNFLKDDPFGELFSRWAETNSGKFL